MPNSRGLLPDRDCEIFANLHLKLYSTLYHPVIQVQFHYSLLTVCTQLTTNWGGGGGRENIGHRTGSGEERDYTYTYQATTPRKGEGAGENNGRRKLCRFHKIL